MGSSPESHAAPKLELRQGHAKIMFPVRLILQRQGVCSWGIHDLFFSRQGTANSTRLKYGLTQVSKQSYRQLSSIRPLHSIGCSPYRSSPLEKIHLLIVTWFPPSIGIHHPGLYGFLICMNSQTEREALLYYSLLLLGIILTFIKYLCLHSADRTVEIILRMCQQRWLPRLLWYKGRQQRETYQSIHISGPDPPQLMILWALPYPFQAQYTNCTWTAPEWAEHCTQQSFRVEDCPCTFTRTHTFAHHILMLQQRFTSFSWHHGQTDIQHAPPLLENRFRWLICIWRNMGT